MHTYTHSLSLPPLCYLLKNMSVHLRELEKDTSSSYIWTLTRSICSRSMSCSRERLECIYDVDICGNDKFSFRHGHVFHHHRAHYWRPSAAAIVQRCRARIVCIYLDDAGDLVSCCCREHIRLAARIVNGDGHCSFSFMFRIFGHEIDAADIRDALGDKRTENGADAAVVSRILSVISFDARKPTTIGRRSVPPFLVLCGRGTSSYRCTGWRLRLLVTISRSSTPSARTRVVTRFITVLFSPSASAAVSFSLDTPTRTLTTCGLTLTRPSPFTLSFGTRIDAASSSSPDAPM